MFDNVGAKIKSVAVTVTWIGIILSCVSGLIVMVSNGDNGGLFFSGLLIIIVGCLASWLGSLALYGFGQLIENSDVLAENSDILVQQGRNRHQAPSNTTAGNINHQTANSSGKHMWRCDGCGNMISGDVCPICNKDTSAKPSETNNAEGSVTKKENTIICPQCKFEQPANRKVCWHCGATFESNP